MSVARVMALTLGVLSFASGPALAQGSSRSRPLLENPQAGELLAKAQAALRRKLQEQQSPTSKSLVASPKPHVVCGMMVIPADPTIDAAMRHPVPARDGVKFTLRTVVPPACRP